MTTTTTIKMQVSSIWNNGYLQEIKHSKDERGNVSLDFKKGAWNFYEMPFEVFNYKYKRVNVDFYGKNTRRIKIGRSFFEVSADNKCGTRKYFEPDLVLAYNIVCLYDNIMPYGFEKKFFFMDKTIQEIVDFFGEKFEKFKLHMALCKSNIPQWCKKRVTRIEDITYWERIKTKLQLKRGEYKDSFPKPTTRSVRTVCLVGKEIPNPTLKEGVMYSWKYEEIYKPIYELKPVSVWTDGFWLVAHLQDGTNKYMCHIWVNEALDYYESL